MHFRKAKYAFGGAFLLIIKTPLAPNAWAVRMIAPIFPMSVNSYKIATKFPLLICENVAKLNSLTSHKNPW